MTGPGTASVPRENHVRAAVHHVAELSTARLGDLVEPDLTGLPAFLAAAAAYRTVLACERVAPTRALRMAGAPPRGTVLVAAFAEVVARLPDVREDHQLSDEVRIAERLLDDLAAV